MNMAAHEPQTPPLQLTGWRRRLAQLSLAAFAALALLVTAVAVPVRFEQLRTPCVEALCSGDMVLLRPEMVPLLTELGLTPDDYARYQITVQILYLAASWGLGALIFARRPDDGMAMLVALSLVGGGLGSGVYAPIAHSEHWLAPVAGVVGYIGVVSVVVIFYIFPDGRFVPRWTIWLALLLALNELIYVGLPGAPWSAHPLYLTVEGLIWVGSFIAIVAVQIYRYRFISTPRQRYQTKLVIFGLALTVITLVSMVVLAQALGLLRSQQFRLFYSTILPLSTMAIPITLAVAVLRYRLYEIDVIIRRTLVYSMLTLILGAGYFGIVVLAQALFVRLVGQESVLAVVASTLAIATLFQPLRARVQEAVDRRFNRTNYDARQVLDQFALRVRDQTDLDALSADLLATVDEALQPQRVELWLAGERRHER
jgi:hypothetical protein